jgi:DNA-binding SARP family transcriptional activator
VRFRILGQLHAAGPDGRAVRLEPRQARLLAALLLAPNQPVARPQLADAAWDDAPPTACRQVPNLVSALRRRLGPVIAADGTGYRIATDRSDVDSLVFADRVRAAQALAATLPERAAGQLRAALALWRGPALAGLAGRTVEAAAAGLDEQRLAVLELCLDLELACGRHRRLVSELVVLVRTHPLREALVGRLMLALYRAGRQADAVAAYQRLRLRLATEIGLDPGPQVRDLYTAILRQEPALAAGPGWPADVTHHPGAPADVTADPATVH